MPAAATTAAAAGTAVWKPHLVLRRFAAGDPELRPGARRNHAQHPDDVRAEIAPTGRSTCHVCRDKVPKGALRVCLMLQCHKGYKNAAFLHTECLRGHPEARKIAGLGDFAGLSALSPADRAVLKVAFEEIVCSAGGASPARKRKQATPPPGALPASAASAKKKFGGSKVKKEAVSSKQQRQPVGGDRPSAKKKSKKSLPGKVQ